MQYLLVKKVRVKEYSFYRMVQAASVALSIFLLNYCQNVDTDTMILHFQKAILFSVCIFVITNSEDILYSAIRGGGGG